MTKKPPRTSTTTASSRTARGRPAKPSKASKQSKPAKAKTARQASFAAFVDDEDPAVVFARALGDGAIVAGLDEAGRGPLAGPVVAAACVLPVPLPEALVPLDDSKKLTEAAREELYPKIVELAVAWGVAVVESTRIDEVNILRASLQAMAEALAACDRMLRERRGEGVLVHGAVVDGNMKAPLPERVAQRTVVGGDAVSRPIMAASILAKVTRDRRMVEEHARFPGYGFDAHKGYGTPQHLKALAALGPCPLHRRSFAPVRVAEGGGDVAAIAVELALPIEGGDAGGEPA